MFLCAVHLFSRGFTFQVWIFGDVWCNMWLALDVWMCTASILNLCAISLDRYVAVTRPITYPSIMSPSRAKMLIAGLWVLSFVICFPPLVGWKDSQTEDDITNTTRPENPHCPWKCELTNEAGYVVYSALGSFYIPMFVMLFFYWRIYRAAIRTTRAINQGFRTTKGLCACCVLPHVWMFVNADLYYSSVAKNVIYDESGRGTR
ncbi:hypothetical protein MTP99_016559 [Tenebrio molitor]|nr:hypothetical protein MTP99_016559 [Tenebrio molitor]